MSVASISDFRQKAKQRLPHFLYEYIVGGSYQETTLRANREDLQRIALRQRVLKDVGEVSTECHLLGKPCKMPVVLAPIGLAGAYARRGEVQAAQAAEKQQTPFTLSTVSLCSVEEVAAAVTPPPWFQLYMIKDRCFVQRLLQRVARVGCDTLMLTVDLPVPGARYRDVRSGLNGSNTMMNHMRRVGQSLLRPRWAWDVGLRGRPYSLGNLTPELGRDSGLADFIRWIEKNFDPTATWHDIDFIRQNWSGKIILKGILDVEDAQQALDLGVDGIVVSNHGGRQLDGTPSTARALTAIAERLNGKSTILADGGVESGLDVVRMLALGADGVLLGRAWAFALAAGGRLGVQQMLQLIHDEMRVAMALTGHTDVTTIARASLVSEAL